MSDFDAAKETLKNLPVAGVAGSVVKSVLEGNVTVLAAPTGSGKSMLLPSMLADASDEPVVVLVPRRFLATDAASNVAQLSGKQLGEEVGFAVGKVGGEESRRSKNTKLLFVTYGYAISSGLINTAKTVVLDEVHEASEDISLARAVLYKRKAQEPDLRILEMSATVNADRQAHYWSDIAKTAVHHVEGVAPACEERAVPNNKWSKSVEQAALELITEEGRNGVAIFRPGIKEIENTVIELERLVKEQNITNVEIASIYGGSTPDARRAAKLPPQPGMHKILVGTNVIESGVNIRWLDSGISDGTGKVPYHLEDSGAELLKHEHLPQWRIIQQMGRLNRDPKASGFEKGIFILHSKEEWRNRPQQATPEIERLSLTNIAFRAASLKLNPEELHFDARVDKARLSEAKENLIRLQLIHDDWSLTDDGKYAASLPLSPETGAMLCEAKRMDLPLLRSGKSPKVLSDAIILAALVENDGMKANYRLPHGRDATSDVLDGFKTFLELNHTMAAQTVATLEALGETATEVQQLQLEQQRVKLKGECLSRNVSFNSFQDVSQLVAEIRNRHHPKELASDPQGAFDAPRYDALKQVILSGKVNGLFQHDGEVFRDLLRDYGNRRNQEGNIFSDYKASDFSVVNPKIESTPPLTVGTLKMIPPKLDGDGGTSETNLTQVTSIPTEVFMKWALGRNDVVLNEVSHNLRSAGDSKVGKRPANEAAAEFSARYFDKATFTLPVKARTAEAEQMANNLADRDRNGIDGSEMTFGSFKPRKGGYAAPREDRPVKGNGVSGWQK